MQVWPIGTARKFARGITCAALLALAGPAAAFDFSLNVRGGPESLERSLTQASLVGTANRDGVTATQDVLAAARSDYARLLETLYAEGYYGGSLRILVDGREAADLPPLSAPREIGKVRIVITPGPQFVFSRTRVQPLAPGTELPDGFNRDAPARVGIVRDAARAGVEAWRDVGHAKAAVARQSITADHRDAQLSVDIGLDPGPRLTFGQLSISGQSAVRQKRLRDITALPRGELFTPDELDASAARLRRTGAFSAVTLREADVPNPDGTLDVDLTVVDQKPRRLGFGAEIESVEGVTLSAFWLHRNLLGGAESLRIDAEVGSLAGETGGLDYSLDARFTRPATFGKNTDLYLEAGVSQLDEPLFETRQARFEIGASRRVTDTRRLEAGIGATYVDVEDDLGKRELAFVLLPLSGTWDRRDDALDPTAGTYMHAEVMPYVGFLDGGDGLRLYGDGRLYRGIGPDGIFVLAGRVQLGAIAGSEIAETPPDLLFFSGGGGTVRGQPYQSNTVRSGGAETGGRSFVGLSGELRARINDSLSAVAFYDAGYIGGESFADGSGRWHSGAGAGLRYNTGFGPIRFDIGLPVDGPGDDGYQLYVGIGQAF